MKLVIKHLHIFTALSKLGLQLLLLGIFTSLGHLGVYGDFISLALEINGPHRHCEVLFLLFHLGSQLCHLSLCLWLPKGRWVRQRIAFTVGFKVVTRLKRLYSGFLVSRSGSLNSLSDSDRWLSCSILREICLVIGNLRLNRLDCWLSLNKWWLFNSLFPFEIHLNNFFVRFILIFHLLLDLLLEGFVVFFHERWEFLITNKNFIIAKWYF